MSVVQTSKNPLGRFNFEYHPFMDQSVDTLGKIQVGCEHEIAKCQMKKMELQEQLKALDYAIMNFHRNRAHVMKLKRHYETMKNWEAYATGFLKTTGSKPKLTFEEIMKMKGLALKHGLFFTVCNFGEIQLECFIADYPYIEQNHESYEAYRKDCNEAFYAVVSDLREICPYVIYHLSYPRTKLPQPGDVDEDGNPIDRTDVCLAISFYKYGPKPETNTENTNQPLTSWDGPTNASV
jgi:hypothetical protein